MNDLEQAEAWYSRHSGYEAYNSDAPDIREHVASLALLLAEARDVNAEALIEAINEAAGIDRIECDTSGEFHVRRATLAVVEEVIRGWQRTTSATPKDSAKGE